MKLWQLEGDLQGREGYFWKMTFYVGLSYALRDLMASAPGLGWSEEELQYPQKVLRRERIPAHCRIVLDRFTAFYSECRLPPEMYEEVKRTVFGEMQELIPCPSCKGTGRNGLPQIPLVESSLCPECQGSQFVKKKERAPCL